MKHKLNLFLSFAVVLTFTGLAAAQSEVDLKRFFEGRRVEVKIDMPATKDGIDVYATRDQPINFGRYSDLLKSYGVSVREGDRIMITKIKVKKKHIEFQLGGGGYGTLGDETSADIYVPAVSKSQREKNLEKDLKDETDERQRRRIREEINRLRREREREDNRNQAEVAAAEELAKQRIQDKRLQSGSRFNVYFETELTTRDLTPRAIINALKEYVDFLDLRDR